MTDPVAKLQPAWQWKCSECGHMNLTLLEPVSFTEEEAKEAREALGIESWNEEDKGVEFGSLPVSANCSNCFLYHKLLQDEDYQL